MPELPEVETIRRELSSELVGQQIKSVQVHRPSVVHEDPVSFSHSLANRSFKQVQRKGKYLIFGFDQGPDMLAHLGMSGKFILDSSDSPELQPHDRVVFTTHQGRLVFSDSRCFGFLQRAKDMENHPRLARLGVDGLDPRLSATDLKKSWGKSSRDIKTLMLQQSPIAGIGNIYAAEILFAAKINPATPAKRLKLKDLQRLIGETHRILELALTHNGTSISDYRRVDDKTGEFQNFLQVYGKAGEPCPLCKQPIERLVQSQRSSFFCPQCQVL